MLDSKIVRTNPEAVADRLVVKGFSLDVERLKSLEEERKSVQVKTESLQHERNARSKGIGKAKAAGEDIAPLLQEVEQLKTALTEADHSLRAIQEQIEEILVHVPNIPDEAVPEGNDEDDNVTVDTWGEPRSFNFEVKDHVDLGASLQQLSFDAANKITGSRFAVMQGPLARLHRALIQFMLDTHTQQHGYQEINVPYLVNKDSLFGTGQLPKFEEDLFKVNDHREFYLIPTAEVPVTNMLRDEIVEESSLPIKFACHTPCFRSEAGSYGRGYTGYDSPASV